MHHIEWTDSADKCKFSLNMTVFPQLRETSFDLKSEEGNCPGTAITNVGVEAARQIRDALNEFLALYDPSPFIKEADPELERLLAEEDEIERRAREEQLAAELDVHVEFGNGTTLEFHRGTMKACIASGRLVTIKATTHEFFQIVAAAHTVDGDPNLMLQALIAASYKGYA